MKDNVIVLEDNELAEIKSLVNHTLNQYDDFGSVEFLKRLPTIANSLPTRLVEFLNEFKFDPPKEGYCIVKNLGVDEEALGPTPTHWEMETNNDNCKDVVKSVCVCSSVLGDMFGWLTQQDGRLVHDVLPIKGHQQEQLGSGSEEELWWHTEDAFHELRGDYVMLACLRNHDAIPTTVGRPDFSKLSDRQIDVLFEKNFTIRPDNSHKEENESEARSASRLANDGMGNYIDKAYATMSARDRQPSKISVLFGCRENPYVRIDPYYMDEPESDEGREALKALVRLIDDAIVEIPLSPGDCVVIDNYLAVHGRRPFKARFDGTDRWFKRLNVVRDIRKYNGVLESSTSRVIY